MHSTKIHVAKNLNENWPETIYFSFQNIGQKICVPFTKSGHLEGCKLLYKLVDMAMQKEV